MKGLSELLGSSPITSLYFFGINFFQPKQNRELFRFVPHLKLFMFEVVNFSVPPQTIGNQKSWQWVIYVSVSCTEILGTESSK